MMDLKWIADGYWNC